MPPGMRPVAPCTRWVASVPSSCRCSPDWANAATRPCTNLQAMPVARDSCRVKACGAGLHGGADGSSASPTQLPTASPPRRSAPHAHTAWPVHSRLPAAGRSLQAAAPGAEPSTTAASPQAPPQGLSASELLEWDVVEYLHGEVEAAGRQAAAGQQLRLGKVTKVDNDEVQVEPLVEEEEGVWVSDDLHPQPVRLLPGCVIRVVEAELGQRQDRDHNPHGEHCHDIWQVAQLNPQVYRGRAARVEPAAGEQ